MAKNASKPEVDWDSLSDKEKWDFGAPNDRAAAALAVNSFFTEAYGKIDADKSGMITQGELKAAATNPDLSFNQRQAVNFVDKHYDKFCKSYNGQSVVDTGNISSFSDQAATWAKHVSDRVFANGVEQDLLAFGDKTGVTQTYFMPGIQQDAKRLSSWIQTNFSTMDLDKDGQVEYEEMDELWSKKHSLSQTAEFRTARSNWHTLAHLVEGKEGTSGFTLKDASALNEAFDPSAKPVAYETWKQSSLSHHRINSFGAITGVSAMFTPFLAVGAFTGPPGWIMDAGILGLIGLAEGVAYLSYRQDANFVKARTAENFYETMRRDIISENFLSDLHKDTQPK